MLNIPIQRRKAKALKAFQYMILSKIVGDRLDEVNNVVLSNQGKDYFGKEVEALRSFEVAVKEKSLKSPKDNTEKNKEFFIGGHDIKYHMNNLHNDLLEKNFIKIIKPYSIVEIDLVAKAIGLSHQEVLIN